MNKLLNFYNAHEKSVILVFGLVVGLAIGLIFAWLIAPAGLTNATPAMLRAGDFRDDYLSWVAEDYAQTGDLEQAQRSLGLDITSGRGRWRDDPVAVLRALAESRGGEDGARLLNLAQAIELGTTPEQPSVLGRTGALLRVFLVLLAAAAVAIAGYLLLRWLLSRGEVSSERAVATRRLEPVAWETEGLPPLTQFVTTYSLGDDFYDPSFSIEKENGDFLGECGVGISEDIGVGDPKKVTALEIWLFDKNDIRTVTKVLMSDYAFNDDALRASLAAKGDLVLAGLADEIELNTATLVLRSRVLELEYGEGQLPPNSFFKRVTMELGVWAKPDVEEGLSAEFLG